MTSVTNNELENPKTKKNKLEQIWAKASNDNYQTVNAHSKIVIWTNATVNDNNNAKYSSHTKDNKQNKREWATCSLGFYKLDF